jgi:transcriptional regulator with XRE-family HTH domain
MRERQIAKISEIADALPRMGLRTLDEQAKALGLLRSTAWNLLRGNHKASGISAGTINRILAAPTLPRPVRTIVLEYVAEKTAGLYGDHRRRLRVFTAQLGFSAREHAR